MRNITRRLVAWAIIVALILIVPLVAMQFTDEVNWTRSDFIVAGLLLFGSALIYELATNNMTNTKNRLAVGIVVAAVLLWLWAELAVGVFTDWGS
jgi:predicted membrane channel-forming protein YqfA (hemolysin III family)